MSSRLQLDMRNLSLGRRHLVNAYEVEAGIGVIAGNIVWSMPEHLECEVLQKVRYINTLTFTILPLTLKYAPKLDVPKWTYTELNHVPKMICTEMDLAMYWIGPCTKMDLLYRKRHVPSSSSWSSSVIHRLWACRLILLFAVFRHQSWTSVLKPMWEQCLSKRFLKTLTQFTVTKCSGRSFQNRNQEPLLSPISYTLFLKFQTVTTPPEKTEVFYYLLYIMCIECIVTTCKWPIVIHVVAALTHV